MRETIDILIRLKKQKSQRIHRREVATSTGDQEQSDPPLTNASNESNGQISEITNYSQSYLTGTGRNIFSDEINEAWEKEKEEIDKFHNGDSLVKESTIKRKSDLDSQSNMEDNKKPRYYSCLSFTKNVPDPMRQENSQSVSETETGSTSEAHKPVYCICQQESYGDMVACDNPDCLFEWFHFACVGVTTAPDGVWICPPCKQQLKVLKRNSNK